MSLPGEKRTTLMLVMQTNVFPLGQTFLKLVRLLNITVPLIDPSLYIHRFASKLEFEDETHPVAM
eukprot:SAG31_NODE_63_length_28659_cov_23.074685_24_plen_65_part_00